MNNDGIMSVQFQEGDLVGIPCAMQPGPFPDEFLVEIKTIHGPLSGFVDEEDLLELDHHPYLRGIVQAVDDDIITVLIRGSYFRTTGIAEFQRQWAHEHLRMAA